MADAAAALFALAALINFAPLIGVLGRSRLERMYGARLDQPDAVVLMRHRAVLFGLVGGMMLWSLWSPSLRPAASIMGLLSMVSFLALARLQGPVSLGLRGIVIADVLGICALVAALLMGY
ncbi:MAG: phosphopantetheine adenylyltransferase [Myxococcales bacterium]|nr:phosphopantetheine adenylyltransferase [Myxococcales bacterium]